MPEALWKRRERMVAALIGGRRNPQRFYGEPNVESDGLALMVSMRNKVSQLVAVELREARGYAGSKKLGGFVQTLTRERRAYITFDLEDFVAWYVSKPRKGGEEE